MNKHFLIGIGVVVVVGAVVVGVVAMRGGGTVVPNVLKKEISVGTDLCGEFPKAWVAGVIGKPIVNIDPFNIPGTASCNYFINDKDFVSIHVDDLSVATQKKGQQEFDRTVKTEPRIGMEDFISYETSGQINSVFLVLNPNKFVSIDRSGIDAGDNELNIKLAVAVAQRIQKGENVTSAVAIPTSSPTPTPQASVPLPQGEDIVRNFFALINEGKISDAVGMLTPNNTNDDSSKQAWGVQLAAFKKVTVKNITSVGENEYKVVLDVEMKPEAASGPIPFYGYENGENTRWVIIEKVGTFWKVTGIATGP